MTRRVRVATAAWFAFVAIGSLVGLVMAGGWKSCQDIGVGEFDAIAVLIFMFPLSVLLIATGGIWGWVASEKRFPPYVLIPVGIALIAATFAITYAVTPIGHPCDVSAP